MMIQTDPAIFFAENYTSARSKFLAAAKIAELDIQNHDHSLIGPDGEILSVDVCYVGQADAENILVLTSGVHGPELMTGSGCQVGLLASGFLKKLPNNVRIVLIHAANPWGSAHLRRNNEDNVDLCRNFISFDTPPVHNHDYDAVKDWLPYAFANGAEGDAARLEIEKYKAEKGMDAFGRGFMAGQYHDEAGVSFGGSAPVWSNLKLQKILAPLSHGTRKICLIDYHSGLGPYAYGTTVCLQSGERLALARKIFGKWILAPNDTNNVEDGKAPSVSGHTTELHENLFANQETVSVVLEFGVEDYEYTAEILMREHRLYHDADADKDKLLKAKNDLLRAFYPADEDWRRSVWSHSLQAVNQALDYLQS